jgi:hypothetical protein
LAIDLEKENDMNELFDTKKLNDEGQKRIGRIRVAFDACLSTVVDAAGNGADPRQMAIVKTNLETACLHAVKAVALNPNCHVESSVASA